MGTILHQNKLFRRCLVLVNQISSYDCSPPRTEEEPRSEVESRQIESPNRSNEGQSGFGVLRSLWIKNPLISSQTLVVTLNKNTILWEK